MLFSVLLDENGKDQGINVRQKVKEMVEFVQDDDRLREERKKAKKNKDKYIGVSSDSMGGFKQSNCKWSNVANLSVAKFDSAWFLQPLMALNEDCLSKGFRDRFPRYCCLPVVEQRLLCPKPKNVINVI